jgi:hypothetical protein
MPVYHSKVTLLYVNKKCQDFADAALRLAQRGRDLAFRNTHVHTGLLLGSQMLN